MKRWCKRLLCVFARADEEALGGRGTGKQGRLSLCPQNAFERAGDWAKTKEVDLRYKPIDGMYMVVKPVVEEVKDTIHDGQMAVLSDALFKYGAYNKFFITCLLISILFGWSFMFSPIVWMDITATDKIFFNSTNSTEAGLPPGLKSFSQVVFTILVALSIVFTNTLLMLNRSMRQFQWNNMKWTIMATLGINGVYTIAAGTM